MSLEETFYVLGIVYMSLMLLIMLATVIAIFIIKARINAIHRNIEEKLHTVTTIANMGEALVEKVKGKH